MRAFSIAATLVLAGATPGLTQQALFVRADNLAAVAPRHTDAEAALRQLCAGPTSQQRVAGYSTHLPAGTRLIAVRRQGTRATLVFDPTLLRATAIEDALEQVQKTALTDLTLRHTTVAIRHRDGSEVDVGALLGQRTIVLPPQPSTAAAAANPVAGALSGRRIAISPGHGYYWHTTLGWTTQRGLIDGLIEDIHTAEICNQYLIPMLRDLGAEIVMTREHGEVPDDVVVDNDGGAPGYTESGAWSTSASSGYGGGGYRFAGTGATETATASWQLPVASAGLYPVYAWFRASSNRTPTASYRVTHQGGTDAVVIDQTVDNLTWVHLGDYWFGAGTNATVVLSNQSTTGGVVIADAVRLGGGLGSIVRGSGSSGQARWRECARYWAQFAGAPSSVYDSSTSPQDNSDDVTARPRFAEWRGADAFVSLHTNAGGGSGTSSFIYSGGATAGSSTLQSRIHTQIITDLRAEWNAGWIDRGQQSANFGEVRLLSTMPGVLLELAFHDIAGSPDHTALHQPEFRYLGARAIARGVMRYFAPAAPFVPEAPTALRVTQDGNRGLAVAWDAAAGAAGYLVEASDDGKGFLAVATTTANSWSTGPLPYHSMRSFRVRSTNASGQSFPTEVLTAGTDHLGVAQALLVQGFDRLDRNVKGPENTRDYLRHFGDGLRRDATFSVGFDAASNEAVQLGRVALGAYAAVMWSLGEESTGDDTFDATEQALVSAYLAGGGGLLVSGAEIGWELDWLGSAADRAFYRNQLGATYIADDANTHTLQAGLAGTVSAGMPATGFDDGTAGTYDVDWPDVIAPLAGSGGVVCLRYGNGLVAGIQKTDATTGARVVNLGFPLDTMTDATARARLVRQSLAFLLEPLPLTAAATAPLGQQLDLELTIPGEAGRLYMLFASEGMDGGVVLPGGGLLPLRPAALFSSSLDPGNPFFHGFLATLDGSGRASPWVDVPQLAFLSGLDVWFAAITVDTTVLVEREITNWVRVRLGP